MKTNWMSFMAAACVAGALHAQAPSGFTPHTLSTGLMFRTPKGWQAAASGPAAMLQPPNATAGAELYIVGMLSEVESLRDPKLHEVLAGRYFPEGYQLKKIGDPQTFPVEGGAGVVSVYDFVDNGMAGRLYCYLVGLKAGGVAVVIGAAEKNLMNARLADLRAVASSISHNGKSAPKPEAAESTPLARQWKQRLNDRKLVQMSGYNSGGGGGGMSSERKLFLASDGSFAYRSSSSVSIYVPGATGSSAGRNGYDGRWRVVERSGQAVLELTAQSGERDEFVLSVKNGGTYLNNARWYVVGINE